MLIGNKQAFRAISKVVLHGAVLTATDSGEMARPGGRVIVAPPGGYFFLITQIAL